MLNTDKKIFCVIPAWNEEKNIVEVLKNVKCFVENIIVVDDSSSDRTYDLAKNQDVIILKHIINRDQGAALQTGNDYALKKEADIIVHFDADGQFLAEEIPDLVNPIIEGKADIVFGSRFMEKKSNMPFIKRRLIMPLAKFFNLFFLNIKMTDPQSGFRVMSREAAKTIKIEQDGKAHCSEILEKAFKYKLRIKEVPITVVYNEFGQKFSGGIKILKDIIISKIIN